jgi:hypothetical protein
MATLNEDIASTRVVPGNPTVISSLPDFVSSGGQPSSEGGKTIVGKVLGTAKTTPGSKKQAPVAPARKGAK